MKFGICVMPDVREKAAFYARAEQLGYDSVWVTDSQMLYLGLLRRARARRDHDDAHPPRRRASTVAPTRIAPVQAAAIATINRLAPGRVFLSVGTGNTAMRSMGAKPMPSRTSASTCGSCAALIDGATVVGHDPGPARRALARSSCTTRSTWILEPRIPLYVSGFGPRSMGLAGEFGDGLVYALPPRGLEPRDALNARRTSRPSRTGGLPELCAGEHRHRSSPASR